MYNIIRTLIIIIISLHDYFMEEFESMSLIVIDYKVPCERK